MQSTASTIEFTIAGQVQIGEYPLLPVRFHLQTAQRDAFGYTAADVRAIAERREGEPDIEPSERPNAYAIQHVYAAALGLCHPAPRWPSLAACRFDVVAYGEGVTDWHLRNRAGSSAGEVLGSVVAEGKRLLSGMLDDAMALFAEAEAAANFTGAPAAARTGE